MLEKIAVLGGDLRQTWLVQQLARSGFDVAAYGVPQLADTHNGLHETLTGAIAVVLPMPALTQDGWIRAGQPIPLRSVLECLRPQTLVFGGMLDAARELLAEYPVRVLDYAESSALAAGNAVPTAEGAIRLAMEQRPATLDQSRCLVIGFGRIGKVLADRLRGLHAAVTVAARKSEDRALSEAMGFAADRTGLYLRGLGQYDCIFNTVPAPVLKKEHLAAMQPDCLILDLATGGGLAPELTLPERPRYQLAPALPGRFAPQTAAEVLRRFILETLSAM